MAKCQSVMHPEGADCTCSFTSYACLNFLLYRIGKNEKRIGKTKPGNHARIEDCEGTGLAEGILGRSPAPWAEGPLQRRSAPSEGLEQEAPEWLCLAFVKRVSHEHPPLKAGKLHANRLLRFYGRDKLPKA